MISVFGGEDNPTAQLLASGLGARQFPSADFFRPTWPPGDVAVVWGGATITRADILRHVADGRRVVYVDKGYTRFKTFPGVTSQYWRASYGDVQPIKPIFVALPSRYRIRSHSKAVRPPRRILISGASLKLAYRDGFSVEKTHGHMASMARLGWPKAEIGFRPRPTEEVDAPPGMDFVQHGPEHRNVENALRGIDLVINVGSNFATECLVLGVPVIELGLHPARFLWAPSPGAALTWTYQRAVGTLRTCAATEAEPEGLAVLVKGMLASAHSASSGRA